MGKYDGQLGELKALLPNAKNILVALPSGGDIDKFAAGLALFLGFEQQGKQVSIVSDDTIRVAQAHLFGVDHIKNTISQTDGGNLTIVLEGVVASNGTVPALEKLDWFPEGQNLNLLFKVLPGQTFRPAAITPKYAGSGYDLIFTIGAANLNALGNLYSANGQIFSGIHLVNIDNQTANTGFGTTNVNDPNSSSVSEVIVDLVQALGLPFDQDIASNLLAGMFETTAGLSNQKVGADTYLSVAQCLRVGGRKPASSPVQSIVTEQVQAQPANTQPSVPPSSGLDLNALFPGASITQPVNSTPDFLKSPAVPQNNQPIPTPSAEERPQMEGLKSADSIEVEPGWLTPKVFKGTSAG